MSHQPKISGEHQRQSKQHRQHQSGFTLLEVMIVVAILAILAATAVPSMIDSMVRSQVKESLSLVNIAQQGVNLTYLASGAGELPIDNKAAGIPDANKIVSNLISAVKVDNGAVTITFGNNASSYIKDKRITFRPAIVADAPQVPIAWVCSGKAVPNGMTVKGVDLTDLKPSWLPAQCVQMPK